jgi:hypothetical protein
VKLFDAGSCEELKLTAHASLGLLAGLCLAYNVTAFIRRGERHLAVNAVVYGALVAYEWQKANSHRMPR